MTNVFSNVTNAYEFNERLYQLVLHSNTLALHTEGNYSNQAISKNKDDLVKFPRGTIGNHYSDITLDINHGKEVKVWYRRRGQRSLTVTYRVNEVILSFNGKDFIYPNKQLKDTFTEFLQFARKQECLHLGTFNMFGGFMIENHYAKLTQYNPGR